MGEFRIGRSRAQHSYPDPRRDTTLPFARNFAVGPTSSTAVTTAGTKVPWSGIESGAPPGVDVPITSKTTGIIRVDGVISIKNSSASPVKVVVDVLLEGSPTLFPFMEAVTVDASGFEAIPILTELAFSQPIGVTRHISFLVTAGVNGAISISMESSSMDVQEVPAATG